MNANNTLDASASQTGASSQPPNAKRLFARWIWISGIVLFFSAVIVNWVVKARADRADLHAMINTMLRSDRSALAKLWHVPVYRPYQFFKSEFADRLAWEPDARAATAMAVTPRSALNASDAIYMLYHGEEPQLLFVLSSTGVFLNQLEVNPRKYPQRLVERRLTAVELKNLDELANLVMARRNRYNPQSPQYIWTEQVLRVLLELKQAQTTNLPDGLHMRAS